MKTSMMKFVAAIFIFSISIVNAKAGEDNRDNNENSATVSTTVMENFSRNFPGATKVIWSTFDKRISGYFQQNGVPVRVIYNKKGKLVYTIRYYNATQVPSKVADAAIAAGYQMPVINVTEIKTRFSVCHLVQMEDKNSITTLLIGDNNEPTVYEEIKKG